MINKIIKKKYKKNKIKEIKKIIKGKKNKLMVFIGPCSIHNAKSAIKFAKIIKKNKKKYKNLLLIMRVFLEKPRTITGWKGFIYDPYINETFKINKGIKFSLRILKKISKLKIPICTEFLNPFIKNYIEKYISVGFIGARNNESQIHREMSSSLDIPIGFKNNLNCEIEGALNSIISCKNKTFCFSMSKKNKIGFIKETNNNFCFLVLRGGKDKKNYKKKEVLKAIEENKNRNIKTGIVIDFSHGNSNKNFKKQKNVCKNVCKQIEKNNKISGVMIESNIFEGNQTIKKKINPYISITDSCLSIKESLKLLKKLNLSIEKRKIK